MFKLQNIPSVTESDSLSVEFSIKLEQLFSASATNKHQAHVVENHVGVSKRKKSYRASTFCPLITSRWITHYLKVTHSFLFGKGSLIIERTADIHHQTVTQPAYRNSTARKLSSQPKVLLITPSTKALLSLRGINGSSWRAVCYSYSVKREQHLNMLCKGLYNHLGYVCRSHFCFALCQEFSKLILLELNGWKWVIKFSQRFGEITENFSCTWLNHVRKVGGKSWTSVADYPPCKRTQTWCDIVKVHVKALCIGFSPSVSIKSSSTTKVQHVVVFSTKICSEQVYSGFLWPL